MVLCVKLRQMLLVEMEGTFEQGSSVKFNLYLTTTDNFIYATLTTMLSPLLASPQ